MLRIVASITTLEQHMQAGASGFVAYRPASCPNCHSCKLWCHGCYYRKADRRPGGHGALNPVAIARFLCATCLHTCSRLPLCIAPRRWHNWALQQAVLLLMLTGFSLNKCSGCTGLGRHTVRRWRDWLHDRSATFAFFLRSRFAELGRSVDGDSFWRNVIDAMGLDAAMAWLDCDLTVP